jgi:purine-binding chemotaxis protein CheW
MSSLHVLFKVAGADYAVAASDVLQMESFDGVTKVPGTPPHVRGIVQIRGRVVPVIDMRARFALPPMDPTLDTRIVVITSHERTVGLLVDSAREVVHIAPGDFRPPPEIVSEQAEGFVKSVAQAGNRLVMLVDFQKIIGKEQIHVE